jgi:hypothetical protein
MSHELLIEVYDRSTASEPIGAAVVGFCFFAREGGVFNDWIGLHYRSELAGKIHIKCVYHED